MKSESKQKALGVLILTKLFTVASQIMFKTPVVLLASLFFDVPAIASNTCELPDSVSIFKLVEAIRKPECNVTSLDDVLGMLPLSMRSKYVLYYQSKSLQGPHWVDYLNPRAILATSEKDGGGIIPSPQQLMLSFNGLPTQKQFNNLEILQIDSGLADSGKAFQYFDIEFPPVEKIKGLSWQQIQQQIIVSEPNPQKCAACHGTPARPVYPSYPFWPGSYGSKFNSINANEKQALNQFLSSVQSNPQSRYRHLQTNPMPGRFKSPENNFLLGRANEQFNFDLGYPLAFQVTSQVQKTPDYSRFKYAIAAADMECADFPAFLPKATLQDLTSNVTRIFNLKSIYTAEKTLQVLSFLLANNEFGEIEDIGNATDTSREKELISQQTGGSSGNSRKALSGEHVDLRLQRKYADATELKLLVIDTFLKQGPSRGQESQAMLRLLFEGRGIDISGWYTDLKQPSYRGLGRIGFSSILMQKDPGFYKFQDIIKRLADFSLTSTQRNGIKQELCSSLQNESIRALSGFSVAKIEKSPFAMLNSSSGVPLVFKNVCLKCHGETKIGPAIPFADPVAFKAWLLSGRKFLIKHRLTGPEDQRMPPVRHLQPDELDGVLKYIDALAPLDQ